MVARRADSRGAVIVETAIVLGFLIFLMLSTADLIFLSSAYINTSQIAREGVMTGAVMRDLFDLDPSTCDVSPYDGHGQGTNLQKSAPAFANCLGGYPSTCGHYLVQWRLEKSIQSSSLGLMTNDQVITRCFSKTGVPDELEVELRGTYRGYSPVFRLIPLVVRQRARIE